MNPLVHLTGRSEHAGDDNSHGLSRTLIIVLSTSIPAAVVLLIALVAFCISRRRKVRFLKRGITPIGDDEIESWKIEKLDEKTAAAPEPAHPASSPKKHQSTKSSVSTIQKPPSVIMYPRPSFDRASIMRGASLDLAAPVTALAPNARPGLTDEMIQGDDAFIPKVKRQPSRLTKVHTSPSLRRHQASRSSVSQSSVHVPAEDWYGYDPSMIQTLARYSSDQQRSTPPSRAFTGHSHVYSSSSTPPQNSYEEEQPFGGLSPRPLLHKSEIGRAIG